MFSSKEKESIVLLQLQLQCLTVFSSAEQPNLTIPCVQKQDKAVPSHHSLRLNISLHNFREAHFPYQGQCLPNPIADAAVVGITLDNNEEYPRAYVTLKDEHKGKITEMDIHKFMKEKVAKHKQLVGGIVFVDEVPKLQSGKIKRALLREWAKRDAMKMRKAKL